ncbi:MAG: phage tail assembly protein [Oligoflexales bacterium]
MQADINKLVGEDPYKFDLLEPIKIGSVEIKSLKLRKPKGKEIRHLDIGSFAALKQGNVPPRLMDQLLKMAESLTGAGEEVINELSADDTMTLVFKTLFLLSQSIKIF